MHVSLDGKERAIDSVFIEHLWKSVKYEDIYLRDYCDGIDLHNGFRRYFLFIIHRDCTLRWGTKLQLEYILGDLINLQGGSTTRQPSPRGRAHAYIC